MNKCPICKSNDVHELQNYHWYCRGCNRDIGLDFVLDTSPYEKKLLGILKHEKCRLLITSAQNDTAIHPGFFNSLKTYCKNRNAHLIVIPYRMKNPNPRTSSEQERDLPWAAPIMPYLLDKRMVINKNLVLMADIKITPTQTRPLSTLESITEDKSGIFGHAKLELVTIATPQNKLAKILTTTGAITKSNNYLDTKAGKRGEFSHILGATLVEKDGGKFYLRQIHACKDGSFIDLDTEYLPTGQTRKVRAKALVCGDLHYEFLNPKVQEATFDSKNSMLKVLKPEYVVLHDAWDGYCITHHHAHQHFIRYFKNKDGRNDVRKSLLEFYNFLDTHIPKNIRIIFPASNHPEFLFRWLNDMDWRDDMTNAHFMVDSWKEIFKHGKSTEFGTEIPDIFKYWGSQFMQTYSRALFLARDRSFTIAGIEVSMHGDRGANGSKGNIASFGKMGVKSIVGHVHTPGIRDGTVMVGVSAFLNMDYAKTSPTSWLNTHCVVYKNGKRSLLIIMPDGSW